MKVKMLKDAEGSPDGIRLQEFTAGKTYEVPDRLAAAFLGDGHAEVGEEAPKPSPKPRRNKKATGPQENK